MINGVDSGDEKFQREIWERKGCLVVRICFILPGVLLCYFELLVEISCSNDKDLLDTIRVYEDFKGCIWMEFSLTTCEICVEYWMKNIYIFNFKK